MPKLGKRKVADIQRAEIARLMTNMASTPAMANSLYDALRRPSGFWLLALLPLALGMRAALIAEIFFLRRRIQLLQA